LLREKLTIFLIQNFCLPTNFSALGALLQLTATPLAPTNHASGNGHRKFKINPFDILSDTPSMLSLFTNRTQFNWGMLLVAQLVEALRYMSEGLRVRFPMMSLDLFIDIILPGALWLWGQLSL
jgi:hypothetical protein